MNNEKWLTVCWHHGFAVQCHCSNFGLPDEEPQTSGKHLWQTVKFAINKQFWKGCHMKKEKLIEEMLLEDVRVVTDLFCSRCFLYHSFGLPSFIYFPVPVFTCIWCSYQIHTWFWKTQSNAKSFYSCSEHKSVSSCHFEKHLSFCYLCDRKCDVVL